MARVLTGATIPKALVDFLVELGMPATTQTATIVIDAMRPVEITFTFWPEVPKTWPSVCESVTRRYRLVEEGEA